VVDPIIGTKRLTKVLMDGGSSLNIMYVETLGAIGIDRSRIRPSVAPFHSIVPGKQAIPLGQIDLPVTFRDPTNYKTETLTFRGGRVSRVLPRHIGATVLHEVHGRPQLYLYEAQDAGSAQGHHRRLLRARLLV
jgi:hypothetical protein